MLGHAFSSKVSITGVGLFAEILYVDLFKDYAFSLVEVCNFQTGALFLCKYVSFALNA